MTPAKTNSRAVAEVRKTAKRIHSVITSYGDTIAAAVDEEVASVIQEGEAPPETRQVLDFLDRVIQKKEEGVVDLDKVRIKKVLDSRLASEAVDQAEGDLRGRIRFVCNNLEEVYGDHGRVMVPFRPSEAQTHGGLIDQTDYMITALNEFQPPANASGATSSAIAIAPPPAVLADSLSTRRGAFLFAHDTAEQERNERRAAEVAQREAVADFQRDAARVRNLLKGFMRFAGLDELTGQLDPRKRSSLANDPTGETLAAPADLSPEDPATVTNLPEAQAVDLEDQKVA